MIRHGWAVVACVGAAMASAQPAASPSAPSPSPTRSQTAIPAKWNGTLLVWSRGFSPVAGEPEAAPVQLRQTLLDAGYGLAGSNLGAGGWALKDAVPAQHAAIDVFIAQHGKPRRIIAWGYSMGGLVTTALAEEPRPVIDGAAAFCASIGGALGMMNMAIDGAHAFRVLVAPDAGIRIVDVDDDRINGKRVADALAKAMETPEGRARVTLAGVLAGLPGWSDRRDPEPAGTDFDAQAAQIAKTFVVGTFLPRTDQEARAGGAFSWTSKDYAAQLARSERRPLVEAMYRKAGLDLNADLRRLAAAPPTTAKPAAVDYMMRHYTPNGRPRVPLVTVQAIGDGSTSPSLQRAYQEAAKGRDVRLLWVRQAGHCGFTPAEVLAGLKQVEARLDTGKWPARPAGFIDYTPPPMLRPCVRGRACN